MKDFQQKNIYLIHWSFWIENLLLLQMYICSRVICIQ
jgi:hypothetical protein